MPERAEAAPTPASDCLAVYGTLAPGAPNAHVLDGIAGTWFEGEVTGHLHETGWGAIVGYPALVWDPAGPRVRVHVLASTELARHWARLDEFEGPEYERIVVPVLQPATDEVIAFGQLYAARA